MSHDPQIGDIFTDLETGFTFKIVDDEDFNHDEENMFNAADSNGSGKIVNHSSSDSNDTNNENIFPMKKICNCRLSDDKKSFIVSLTLLGANTFEMQIARESDQPGAPVIDLKRQLSEGLLQEKLGKGNEIKIVPMSLISILNSNTGAMKDTEMILCDDEESENTESATDQNGTDKDVYYMVIIRTPTDPFDTMRLVDVERGSVARCEEYIYTHRPHEHQGWDSPEGATAFIWFPNIKAAFGNLGLSHVLSPEVRKTVSRRFIGPAFMQRHTDDEDGEALLQCDVCIEDFGRASDVACARCCGGSVCRECAVDNAMFAVFCPVCREPFHMARTTREENFSMNFFILGDLLRTPLLIDDRCAENDNNTDEQNAIVGAGRAVGANEDNSDIISNDGSADDDKRSE